MGIASILEDTKVLGVFGDWVVWILEELYFDLLSHVQVRAIYLVHLLHVGNKRNWRSS
jgi:hypothetical protein